MEFAFSEKIGRIDSSPIRKAFELAAKIQDPINLSIGQPHFPTPPRIIQAMVKALEEGKTAYTMTGGIQELKNALENKYQTTNQIKTAKAENILITSGIGSALFLLFNTIIDPGDECLMISPYFLMYPSMIQFYGGKTLSVHEDFNQDDLKKFESKKLKIIIYSSPSNPSGKILTKNQLQLLADLAEKTGAYLISDEIYEVFDYDKKFISVGSFYEKAITLTGFSKTYSMTGLRLASILAPNPVIQNLTKLQQYTVVCAPAPTQWAGIEALNTDMTPYVDDYRKKRDFVYESLKDHYDIIKSDGAFYYFLKIKGDDKSFIERAITEKKLLLVPGFIFCESNQYVRLSYAAPQEKLELGMKALQELAD
jgi:aminotransferase